MGSTRDLEMRQFYVVRGAKITTIHGNTQGAEITWGGGVTTKGTLCYASFMKLRSANVLGAGGYTTTFLSFFHFFS